MSFIDQIAREFHLGGEDLIHPALDAQAYVNDPTIADDPSESRHYLPQLGPQFVAYVRERFDAQDELMRRALAKWSEKAQTMTSVSSMTADANGNISRALSPGAIILDPPVGWTFALHRLTINVGGSNFGTPFTVAGGYWELRVDDEAIDGGSLVSGQGSFPVVRTWGTRDAPHIRDGELASLFVSGTGTFAGKSVTAKSQYTAVREIEG